MSKKTALKRGLGQLLSTPVESISQPANTNGTQLCYLGIERLQPGQYQPRQRDTIDKVKLAELAESIKAHGIIQPIVVRKLSSARYEIIAGERRWRAAQLAQISEVPVIIKTVSDENVMAMALIENIQRENLNPLEEAEALYRLLHEFDLTHEEIAQSVGKSRTAITNYLRLLQLCPSVKRLLGQGELSMGHAKVILPLEEKQQIEAATMIVEKSLSVREAEKLVKQLQTPKKIKTNPPIDPDVTRLENNLSDKLGAVVSLRHTSQGKGKIVIQYNSLDELDGILEHMT